MSLQDQLAKLSLNAEAGEALEKEGASILKSLREREMLEEESIPELIDAVTTELQAVRQQGSRLSNNAVHWYTWTT